MDKEVLSESLVDLSMVEFQSLHSLTTPTQNPDDQVKVIEGFEDEPLSFELQPTPIQAIEGVENDPEPVDHLDDENPEFLESLVDIQKNSLLSLQSFTSLDAKSAISITIKEGYWVSQKRMKWSSLKCF